MKKIYWVVVFTIIIVVVIIFIINFINMTSFNDENVSDIENVMVNDEEIEATGSGSLDNTEEYVLHVDGASGYTEYEYKLVDSGENYTVELEVDTDKYRVTVFNGSGVIFKDVFFGTAPVVEILDNNLVQIFKGVGSGANFSIFVDTEKELISNALSIRNPAFIVNERVLSVEEIDAKVYATFTSLFDAKASVDRYELKNADNSNQVPDIEDVGYSNDDTILIKYFDVDGNLKSQEIKVINSGQISKERNVYNKENEDVNRFLQYLNDEIPVYT